MHRLSDSSSNPKTCPGRCVSLRGETSCSISISVPPDRYSTNCAFHVAMQSNLSGQNHTKDSAAPGAGNGSPKKSQGGWVGKSKTRVWPARYGSKGYPARLSYDFLRSIQKVSFFIVVPLASLALRGTPKKLFNPPRYPL